MENDLSFRLLPGTRMESRRMNREELDQAFRILNLRMFGVMDEIKEVRKRRREIVERRHQKLDELGAFDEEGHVIQELLDDEARELGAERGRLTHQLLELISQDRANHAIHSELMSQSLVLRLPRPHQAAYWGDAEEMTQLIDDGADLDEDAEVLVPEDVNYVRRPKMTPLNVALWRGKLEIVELLLSSDSRDPHDFKSVNWAIEKGEVEILKMLIGNEDMDFGCLHYYLMRGHYTRPGPKDPRRREILRLLLEGGADVRKTESRPLVDELRESVFNPPLTYLYAKRPRSAEESESNLAMLKLLLAFGADPNQRPDYSLIFPWHIGQEPSYPLPVLHSASRWGEEEAVEVLLSAGAKTLLEDKVGAKAVHWCALDNPCHEVLRWAENLDLAELLTSAVERGVLLGSMLNL